MHNKYQHQLCFLVLATVGHVGTYHICELRRPGYACVSAQTCQRFRCLLTQSIDLVKSSDQTLDLVPLDMSAWVCAVGVCACVISTKRHNWASTREAWFSWVGKQQRRRPACAFAQSYQCLVIRLLESILSILPINEMSLV